MKLVKIKKLNGWKGRYILPVKFMDHRGLPVAPHHHLLLLQLFCHLHDNKKLDSNTKFSQIKFITQPAGKQ